jgi:hypothetical protein
MKWVRVAGSIAGLVFSLAVAASGVAEEEAGAAGNVCDADAARLCADAADASTRTLCLMQHKEDLSDACRAENQRDWSGAFAEACAEETKQRCATAPGGALGRIGCLVKHREELSEPCQSYVEVVTPSKKP